MLFSCQSLGTIKLLLLLVFVKADLKGRLIINRSHAPVPFEANCNVFERDVAIAKRGLDKLARIVSKLLRLVFWQFNFKCRQYIQSP